MGVCCIVFDIDGMFVFFMIFFNIEKNIYIQKQIVVWASEPVGGKSRATKLSCLETF